MLHKTFAETDHTRVRRILVRDNYEPIPCRSGHIMRLESWNETTCREKCTRCGEINVYMTRASRRDA